MTIVYKKNDDFVNEAKNIFLKGGLIAFPTETVYGLGANALDEKACSKIFEAKGRPSDNPLIVHIGYKEMLKELVEKIPDEAQKLIDKFWPGPLTIILKKSDKIPNRVSGGLDTVAVRMPSDETALKLLKGTGLSIAAPSANTSGKPSPTKAEHVLQDMDGKIDMVIDGGKVQIGIESTIIDLSDSIPKILRPGEITPNMIEEAIGLKVEYDVKITDKPKAPGMKYRHYAPKGTLVLLDGSNEQIVRFINLELQKGLRRRVAIITTDQYKKYMIDRFLGVKIFSYGNGSIDEAASKLYSILRKCDEEDISIIYSIVFNKKDKGYSLMNRLEKAADLKIIKLDEVL